MMGRRIFVAMRLSVPLQTLCLLLAAVLCPAAADAQGMATSAGRATPAEDGQWLMPAKNYASTRFSGLEEITVGNAKNLKVAWTFSTGVTRGHEAAPLVVGGVMYVVTPYPNVLYALDLANAGAVLWKYEPKPAAA